MFLKKVNNIFTSALPLYYYSKAFGIFLPSFTKNIQDGKLSVKILDKIWFLIIFIATVFVLFLNITKDNQIYTSSSILLVTAWEICGMVGIISMLIVQIYQYFYANEIADTLVLIHAFDEKVN